MHPTLQAQYVCRRSCLPGFHPSRDAAALASERLAAASGFQACSHCLQLMLHHCALVVHSTVEIDTPARRMVATTAIPCVERYQCCFVFSARAGMRKVQLNQAMCDCFESSVFLAAVAWSLCLAAGLHQFLRRIPLIICEELKLFTWLLVCHLHADTVIYRGQSAASM